MKTASPAPDRLARLSGIRSNVLADHSALAALQGLAERYRKAGKQLRMKNLSERNRQLLSRAGIGFA